MDGLLVIDKPPGPTSHDVVARLRRVLGERRIGHTGTLDPAASGVLPLVLGRATRLARFLSAGDKGYDAVIRFGIATDTYDAEGAPLASPYRGPMPSRDAIDRALDAFRGTYLQQPPAFSAKKIEGTRSHRLARARARDSADQHSFTGAGAPRRHPNAAAALGTPPPARTDADASPQTARHATPARLPRWGPRHGRGRSLPAPVRVTAYAVEIVGVDGDTVTLHVDCSAGFYVRALAHDLGERLGTGAHLARLRRTSSGDFTLADALSFESAERNSDEARRAVVPLAHMLPRWSSVVLTDEGARRVAHGRDVRPDDITASVPPGRQPVRFPPGTHRAAVRLLDPRGDLIGIAEAAQSPGLLHPSVVLV